MFASGKDADEVAARRASSRSRTHPPSKRVVDEVIAENAEAADKVRSGNLGTIGFLVGQVMKKTRGQANPGLVNELLRSKLGL